MKVAKRCPRGWRDWGRISRVEGRYSALVGCVCVYGNVARGADFAHKLLSWEIDVLWSAMVGQSGRFNDSWSLEDAKQKTKGKKWACTYKFVETLA